MEPQKDAFGGSNARRACPCSSHSCCAGQPFTVAYPTLPTARRPYSVLAEADLFDGARVRAYLADWEWRRTVDSTGKIALARSNHLVGQAYRGQVVKIRFDPADHQLVCRLADAQVVARLDLPEATPIYLMDVDHKLALQAGA